MYMVGRSALKNKARDNGNGMTKVKRKKSRNNKMEILDEDKDLHLSSSDSTNNEDNINQQYSLNLIGASLGITLNGKPARHIYSDFLHEIDSRRLQITHTVMIVSHIGRDVSHALLRFHCFC